MKIETKLSEIATFVFAFRLHVTNDASAKTTVERDHVVLAVLIEKRVKNRAVGALKFVANLVVPNRYVGLVVVLHDGAHVHQVFVASVNSNSFFRVCSVFL